MNRTFAGKLFALAMLAALAAASPARAGLIYNILRVCRPHQVDELNKKLAGRVLDFTKNHWVDRRVYSPSLGEKRDMYVYLPPGYDGTTPFPLMVWLHGVSQDEKNFLDIVHLFDNAIRGGVFPPVVLVVPDGTLSGNRPALMTTGSFFMNSKSGRFEDYIVRDVWEFAHSHFCLRKERGAQVLAGASMGGFGAYSIGFRNRHQFGVLVGILPPLDIRYADCHDNYRTDYDPNCNSYRERMKPHRVIGRFYGVIALHEHRLTDPTVGRRNPNGMTYFSAVNPVELLDSRDIQPGEFEMFIGYAKKDQLNLDAQAEHFIDKALRRGLRLSAVCLPDGTHDSATGMRVFPVLGPWLSAKLAAYKPPGYAPPAACGRCTELLTAAPRLGLFRRPPADPVWVVTEDGPATTPTSPYSSGGRTP